MLVFGVGVFDEKAGPDNKVPRAYWSGILRRCYSEESLVRWPSYRGTTSGDNPLYIIPGKFNINCPRAVTGARRKVTDTEGNVMHFHAETGLDIYPC